MAEETSNAMNLDLNLGPNSSLEPGSGSVPVWLGLRAAARQRARQRWRWRQVQIPPRVPTIPMDLNGLMVESADGIAAQAGEGSAAAGERANEIPKSCDNATGFAENRVVDKKDDGENCGGNDGSFFDCNICLDMATEPVVTCCGHLFCWPCLYRWLHVHADVKECPVCKGEVTDKNVTPIYGRGNHVREPEDDLGHKIPLRPHARRIESLRQTIHRTAFNIPLEEMIRHLGNRFDLTRDLIPPPEPEFTRETAVRTSPRLERFMLAREISNGGQNPVLPPDDVVDFAQSGVTILEGRNHGQPPPVDDRDSFSSIAAVINSENQVDTAVEIDSLVSLSTSSSRRRSDASRVTDFDSGNSRAPRRRRLN